VDEVERRLYSLPPEEFVAARDEAAHATKDQRRAAEIVKMRRPTVAAWMVNLLAIKRPELLADLAELAGALRTAQRELQGSELRALSQQRRAAVSALVAEARRLAIEAKPALGRGGNLPLADVEHTLQAALAEPEAADLVRSGRLLKAIEYAGFGEVPRPQLRVITGGTDSTVEAPARPDRRRAERELAAARTAESEAQAELERATAAERDGARELAELDAELAAIQQRRAEAEEEFGRRKLARKGAERQVAAARRRVGEAEAALEDRPAKGRSRTG
jgi:hypothetical protein